jgi:hypothetical protein
MLELRLGRRAPRADVQLGTQLLDHLELFLSRMTIDPVKLQVFGREQQVVTVDAHAPQVCKHPFYVQRVEDGFVELYVTKMTRTLYRIMTTRSA